MPQIYDFIDTYARTLTGEAAPPDPFTLQTGGRLDPWKGSFFGPRRPTRTWEQQVVVPDDGDPGHAIADERAQEAGVDVTAGNLDLLTIARSQLGSPYVWAASNPQGDEGGAGTAFDCSGYTLWVLSRFGIKTPHMASEQQKQFQTVGKDALQPGDLVFFNYGRKGPGIADHVGIYVGHGDMIDASSSNGEIVERPVDWANFIGGGATGIAAEGKTSGRVPHEDRGQVEGEGPVLLVDDLMSGGTPAFGSVLASMLAPAPVKPPRGTRASSGTGSVKSQLYQGFIDAGRADLAKMVYTKAFDTWIRAESGWNPEVVSKDYPGHGRNAGLFQFALLDRGWVWDDVNESSWTYSATPYDQARMVARYFSHLTPGAIRSYAEQVQAGTYGGWG